MNLFSILIYINCASKLENNMDRTLSSLKENERILNTSRTIKRVTLLDFSRLM